MVSWLRDNKNGNNSLDLLSVGVFLFLFFLFVFFLLHTTWNPMKASEGFKA
jgi:hypothetical protein